VRILIVDDNDEVRTALRSFLQHAEPTYIVDAARDGKEALNVAQTNKPDIVVLDLVMPVMSGLSAARLISHRFPGTKILLHTVHRTDILNANANRYGVFRIVDKTDGKNLLDVIRQIDSPERLKTS
jgi:DNA-binding NarL/FixJ family response regulator